MARPHHINGGRPKGSKDSYKRGSDRLPAPGYGYIADLAKQHTPKAIARMAFLMENAQSESVQLAAAIALYDRAWGKPQQNRIADNEPPVHYYTTREIHAELVRRGLASVLGLSTPKVVDTSATEIKPRPSTTRP